MAGRLEKLQVRNEDTKETFAVLFNPSEYTIEDASKWSDQDRMGQKPELHYTGGQRRKLTMELFFDTYESRKDVREHTFKIANLLVFNSEVHRPPKVTLGWGPGAPGGPHADFPFTGVLESLKQQFVLFLSDGTPVRAKLSVGFLEFTLPQEELQANPANSPNRTKAYVVQEADTALGHYFVTASASEALGIDAGAAGPGWVRTGRSFQAWSTRSAAPADALGVCRFYSSGANSHFYTASADECLQLRGMEAAERAQTGGVKGWSYEGTAFFIEGPRSGQCPAGTTKVTRVYNNGFANGEGANHRFVDDADLQAMMVDQQWLAEGAAFCAKSKPTGTDADLPATTTSFDSVAGTWTGSAAWKAEAAGAETRARHDFSLTIAADGSLTGTGDGCAFTGQLTTGDGFRAFFRGTATATACTDAPFDGDYPRLRLQRFGDGTLMVRFQREDDVDGASTMNGDGNEVSIDGLLTNGTTPAPPPTPSPTIAGDWAGTVAWLAVQHMASGNIFERVSSHSVAVSSWPRKNSSSAFA